MLKNDEIHKTTRQQEQVFDLYLYRYAMRVPSLSLLPPVLGCSSMWPCAYERVFSMCEGECMYLQLSPLICMRYSYLAQCTALEQEWVHFSPRVCVCMRVCGYTDLQTECRPKHKSGFCLSSLQTCQWLQHGSTVPPRTWHSHWDRWTGTYALEGFVIIQHNFFHPVHGWGYVSYSQLCKRKLASKSITLSRISFKKFVLH